VSGNYSKENWTSLVVSFFKAIKTRFPNVIFGLTLIDDGSNVQFGNLDNFQYLCNIFNFKMGNCLM